MKKLFLILVLFVPVLIMGQDLNQKMEELLKVYADNKQFNGSVLVARNGKVLIQKGMGYRNAEDRSLNDANTIFQIGSVTKQFTAAIIMQLEQEGKLSLSDTLGKYFKGFPNGNKITIEHLLTHTSGMFNYTDDSAVMEKDVTLHYSEDELIDLFRKYNPDFEPGTKWSYSNTGYSMLGYIIQKVTGKSYELNVRERIFQPLGMERSGFDFTNLKDPNKARGYFFLNGDESIPAPIVDSTIAYSAGAIYSSVNDLLKWERAINEEKILKTELWNRVFTPYKNNYGYGWAIDTLYGYQYMAHSGGIHGFASFLMRIPKEELLVVVTDNSSSRALSKISKSLAAIALEKPYELPPVKKAVAVETNVLKEYIGEYELAPGFVITVTLDGDQLKGQATGQPSFDLFAEKKDHFFLKVVDARIEFVRDDKGKVIEMILYQNGMEPRGKKIK